MSNCANGGRNVYAKPVGNEAADRAAARPCPWCGEEPVDAGNGRVAHACYTIDMQIGTSKAAWNRRAGEEQLEAQLANRNEALAEKVEQFHDLNRRIADLEGMLGELPPEGKAAMLRVCNDGGELSWKAMPYDHAAYLLVDSEADSFTGSDLNDPFGRADWGDKLTMARTLREMADRLDRKGDVLGLIDKQHERIVELEELAWGARGLVRCRNCAHSRIELHTGDERRVCWRRKSHGEVVSDDGFCHEGTTEGREGA